MFLTPRPARPAVEALTSKFEVSMHSISQYQTSKAVDMTVNMSLGAFVALPATGHLLIHGLPAVPLVALLAPLLLAANRSYLRYRLVRFL
ncbi:hypothetical protein [Streptomyces sp. 8N706]|uniref:hypothetical protein n=1 Tax=Streptomyces sp. 8N706 TaxID=3457416 RepID=UPI003FD0D110